MTYSKNMNNELLNEVAAVLNITDKNVVITATIKSLIDIGFTVKESWEMVFGDGSYEKLASDVWQGFLP